MAIRKEIIVPATVNKASIIIERFSNGEWATYIDGYIDLNVSSFKDKRKLRNAIYKTIKDIRNTFGSLSESVSYLQPSEIEEEYNDSISSYIDSLI